MTYRLIINNCIEEIAKLNPFVEKVSEGFCIARDTLFKLQLALDEALSNSVKYAYPKGFSGTVTLEAEKINRSLIFRLIDEGVAFDPTEPRGNIDLTSKAEERPIGGLGIFLIKQMMDDVRYERLEGHNILIMKKNI